MAEPLSSLRLGPDAPTAPDAADREWLLDALADLVAARGAEPLLAPPVEPGPAAFPEPWRPTRAGVAVVARRCAAHAGLTGIAIDVIDARPHAVVDARESTELDVDDVGLGHATLALERLGADDVAGTMAHAIGAVIAAMTRLGQDGPFRATEHAGTDEDTRRRGGVAAVWAGLGALAINAAYQHYNSNAPINAPTNARVFCAGAVPMSALAFLVAVQAELRGGELPGGLKGPQRDESRAWRRALAGKRDALRARLAIAEAVQPSDARPPLEPIDDEPEDGGEDDARTGHGVFRVRGDSGAVGTLAGMAAGGVAVFAILQSTLAVVNAVGVLVGGLAGYAVGRRREHTRCADCDVAVADDATACPSCEGTLGRYIRHRNDRLAEAEKDTGEAA
jgi:hypothetical protein